MAEERAKGVGLDSADEVFRGLRSCSLGRGRQSRRGAGQGVAKGYASGDRLHTVAGGLGSVGPRQRAARDVMSTGAQSRKQFQHEQQMRT